MIEAPEARYLSEQLNRTVRGKKITDVFAQYTPHKFAWFYGNPEEYPERLAGKTIDEINPRGGMIEIKAGEAHGIHTLRSTLTDSYGWCQPALLRPRRKASRQTPVTHWFRRRELPGSFRTNVWWFVVFSQRRIRCSYICLLRSGEK